MDEEKKCFSTIQTYAYIILSTLLCRVNTRVRRCCNAFFLTVPHVWKQSVEVSNGERARGLLRA